MGLTQASRLLTPEEIAAQAGHRVPFLRLPERASVFADRETRLRQLAAGHPMRDYLLFVAEIVRAQHELLSSYPDVAVPKAAGVDAAAKAGLAPLEATGWPRDPAWRVGLHRLLDLLLPRIAGSPGARTARALRDLGAAEIERQAERLINGVMLGLDLGAAPLVAAGLQAYFTHLVLATEAARRSDRLAPFGRTDDPTLCPCCGSRPSASISRIGGEDAGYRYLHCSLCSTQWHFVRIKCAGCSGTQGIHYQSLAPLAGQRSPGAGLGQEAVQAETCDVCGRYLKIVHMERDPHVEPIADDLASITLDLLVAEEGRQRHGVNLLLLFGDADHEDPAAIGPPIAASPGGP
jgi:FdhE protein